jgi:hypothetical protein
MLERARLRLRPAAMAAAAIAALSCASAPPPPASLTVEVWSGAPAAAKALADVPVRSPRVAIVVDLSTSMQVSFQPDGPTRAEAARAEADRLLRALPVNTRALVETLGAASGASCTPAVRLEADPAAADGSKGGPASLVGPLQALTPHSESSLDETLGRVGEAIASSGSSAGWHVVVVSDFGSECGGDPCAAIERLVGRGVPVDLVDLAQSGSPACAPPPPAPPSIAAQLAPAPPPAFRVEAPADAATPHALLSQGRAGGPPVAVPPGPAAIVVDLTPPLTVGPIVFGPGEQAHLEVLHFPAASPPVGRWRLESEPTAGEPR